MLFFDKVIQEHITSEALLTSSPVFEVNELGRAIPSPFSHRQLKIMFEDMKTVVSSQVHISEHHAKMLEFTFRGMAIALERYAGSNKEQQAEGTFIDDIFEDESPIEAPDVTEPSEEDSILELCKPLMPKQVNQDLGSLLYRLEEDYPGAIWREKLTKSYSNGKFDISSLPTVTKKLIYTPVYPGTELEPGYAIHDPNVCNFADNVLETGPKMIQEPRTSKTLLSLWITFRMRDILRRAPSLMS
jgi:hypothetical protein